MTEYDCKEPFQSSDYTFNICGEYKWYFPRNSSGFGFSCENYQLKDLTWRHLMFLRRGLPDVRAPDCSVRPASVSSWKLWACSCGFLSFGLIPEELICQGSKPSWNVSIVDFNGVHASLELHFIHNQTVKTGLKNTWWAMKTFFFLLLYK